LWLTVYESLTKKAWMRQNCLRTPLEGARRASTVRNLHQLFLLTFPVSFNFSVALTSSTKSALFNRQTSERSLSDLSACHVGGLLPLILQTCT
jgi:hypothetical protein